MWRQKLNIYRKSPKTCWNSQTLAIFVLSGNSKHQNSTCFRTLRFRGHDSEVQCTRQTYWKGQRTAKWRPCKGQGSDLCTGPRPLKIERFQSKENLVRSFNEYLSIMTTLFDRQKADKLSKVDLSRKGSVDAPIFDFLNNLNSHQDYVSLSSCSGRIIIFISGENVKKVCSTKYFF